MNKEIVSYNPTKAALADLTARYKGLVFEVTTPTGMAEAKAAYKDINAHSIALENARKKEKAESLEYGRFVDAEAKRIDDQLEAIRLPIKTQIETETKREEREREAKIKAEQERIEAEQRAAKAAEEARMAAERAEIKRQQDELAKAAAEQARLAAESRAKIEAEERAARQKIEDEQRAARAAQEVADRAAKVLRDAEEAKIKAERDRLEADRRAAEDAARALREAEEAVKRKAQAESDAKAKAIRDAAEAEERKARLEALAVADMNGALRDFRSTYGHRPEVADIITAIDTYLAALAVASPEALGQQRQAAGAAGPV